MKHLKSRLKHNCLVAWGLITAVRSILQYAYIADIMKLTAEGKCMVSFGWFSDDLSVI